MNVESSYSTVKLRSSNQAEIHVHQWTPPNCRGVIQVAHGLSEHGKRYHIFAEAFADLGFAVIANDHQGHGLSLSPEDIPGHVDSDDIWGLLIEDIKLVNAHIREILPNKPVVLFGHSMGAILGMSALQAGLTVDAAILSALAPDQPALLGLGKGIASIQKTILGAQAKAGLLRFASFGVYNMQFKPNRTDFDWLSRDSHEVDKYINDPMCGIETSVGYFQALFNGLSGIYKKSNLQKLNSKIPMLIYAGSDDPVAGKEQGFMKTLECLRVYLPDLEWKIYPEGRHEMHNEKNREEVLNDLHTWIKDHFSS